MRLQTGNDRERACCACSRYGNRGMFYFSCFSFEIRFCLILHYFYLSTTQLRAYLIYPLWGDDANRPRKLIQQHFCQEVGQVEIVIFTSITCDSLNVMKGTYKLAATTKYSGVKFSLTHVFFKTSGSFMNFVLCYSLELHLDEETFSFKLVNYYYILYTCTKIRVYSKCAKSIILQNWLLSWYAYFLFENCTSRCQSQWDAFNKRRFAYP